jgi:hypothetical protein
MSGETEKNISGWTVDTLHEHTLTLVNGVVKLFESREKALFDKIMSVEKESEAALRSANVAIDKSEKSIEKRFDGVNEFRKALGDQTVEFVRKTEVEIRFNAVASDITVLRAAVNTEAGKDAGKQNFVTTSIAIASIITVVAMGFYTVQHSGNQPGTVGVGIDSKRVDDLINRFDALSNRMNGIEKQK